MERATPEWEGVIVLRTGIVIPTFSETGNIRPLASRITAALEGNQDYEIIFVDDSTDDTPVVEIAVS